LSHPGVPRSPEYRLTKTFRELPAGTFVKPIRPAYLSRERREQFHYFNPNLEAICWTPMGYSLIPLELIEEIP
jgi:hypothetical protein